MAGTRFDLHFSPFIFRQPDAVSGFEDRLAKNVGRKMKSEGSDWRSVATLAKSVGLLPVRLITESGRDGVPTYTKPAIG
jgi:hypothetical protein